MSGARRALLEGIAARVPKRAPDGVRVGIDGVDGVGKTVFADHLAAILRTAGRPVVRVSADDFHHPREVRYRRGRTSPKGFWLDSYDYSALWETGSGAVWTGRLAPLPGGLPRPG